jgi:predicted nucleotidyltransferase
MEFNLPLKYQKDIEVATNLLKNEGCQSIYLFGSMVTGKIHENSDIERLLQNFSFATATSSQKRNLISLKTLHPATPERPICL